MIQNDPKHPLDKRPDSVATVPLQMQNFQDIPTVSNTAVNNNLKNIPGDGLLFLNKQQTLRQVQADEFDQISRTESGSIVSNSKSETSTDPPCLVRKSSGDGAWNFCIMTMCNCCVCLFPG